MLKKVISTILSFVFIGFSTPLTNASQTMSLSSPVVAEMGNLPALYTCDGSSISPPLSWKNAPKGTKYFALTMYTIPKDGPDHWYFSVWDIPGKVNKLPEGNLKIGQVGGNGENPNLGYAPPCSQGPGPKKYTFTLYALSRATSLGSSSSSITRADLISAVSKITLAQATLNVMYSRPNGFANATRTQ